MKMIMCKNMLTSYVINYECYYNKYMLYERSMMHGREEDKVMTDMSK